MTYLPSWTTFDPKPRRDQRGACALGRTGISGGAGTRPLSDRTDREIRRVLEAWLLSKHYNEPDTVLIHELDIPRPSARVDLALINGRLAGYEIKSHSDTLARLLHQQESFSTVFERMTLVVAERHTRKCMHLVPNWWGIIEVSPDGLHSRQRGRLNPQLDLTSLLYVLAKSELQNVEERLGLGGPWSRPKPMIIKNILSAQQRSSTIGFVREALKRRRVRRLDVAAA